MSATDQPKFIAHYRVARLLGSGGMGEVFLAEDTRLDRLVALKLLPKEVAADAARRKRFLAEAKAASALNHSNVCTIYEVGETAEGQPFIAMEYLEGQALDLLTRRRRLDLGEIVGIGVQVAEALEAARQSHVVHRDIKPGNIVMDAQGRVKVVDFGLAKRLDEPGDAPALTQEGAVIGTPNYLSPELALGREVDSRSDIFSLGVVLYELAAGKNPFAGASFGETVNNILNRQPEPLRPWNPNVTPEFERVVRKCLERDAAKRYATPAQLRDDLRKLQPNLQTSRSSTRTVLMTAAVIMALGAVCLGVAWLLRSRPAARPTAAVEQKSIAVLPFVNMSDETNNAFFADGIHEDILATLALVRDLKVVSRTSVVQYRGTTKTMRQIAQELGVAYVLEGSVRRAGNKIRVTGQLIRAATDEHVWAKSYDRDLTDIFAIQSALATEIAGALQAAISPQEKSLIERRPTENLAAYDLYLKGRGAVKGSRPDLTQVEGEQALAEAVKMDPNFAAAWGYLAEAHAMAVFSQSDTSTERLAKAKAAIETAVRLAPDDPDVIEQQGNYYYYGYRDYTRAVEQYQRLLVTEPSSANAYTQLGFVRRRQGRLKEALANFRHALEFDPLNVEPMTGIGETLLALRHYDEATAQLRRVAEVSHSDYFMQEIFLNVSWIAFFARGSTREGDEWVASLKPSPGEEAKVLLARRNWARTRGDWALAVKIDHDHPYLDPYDDPHWAQDVATIGDLVGNNEVAVARIRAQNLVPELKSLLGQQAANANLWGNLAMLQVFLGDKDAGLASARKAVELLPESTDAVEGPRISVMLGEVRAWAGDKDGALAELARQLHTPFGANVYATRVDPTWLPLRGDPRFEALLNDPRNNAPLP